jgi:hypothetical protein
MATASNISLYRAGGLECLFAVSKVLEVPGFLYFIIYLGNRITLLYLGTSTPIVIDKFHLLTAQRTLDGTEFNKLPKEWRK